MTEMVQGDTEQYNVSVVNENENPVDLTGASIVYGAGRSSDGQAISKSVSDGSITITDATNGEFTFTIESADTSDLDGSYMHMIKITDSGGNTTTVFQERLLISEDYT